MLVLGASLRKASFNAMLAALAARELAALGAQIDLAQLCDFDAPLYDQDLLDASGFPPGIARFLRRLSSADAFAIASPEYVFSIPGSLKNLIDWTSQDRPIPWAQKPGLLLSASVSSVGGERGLWALRVPLDALGAHLLPQMFSLPNADEKLNPAGELVDPERAEQLRELLRAFIVFAGKFAETHRS